MKHWKIVPPVNTSEAVGLPPKNIPATTPPPAPLKEGEGWEAEFIEKGADLEHTRWANWQRHLHGKCVEDQTGAWMYFPKELWQHWERQIATPYNLLSEKEKESDRKEVRTYLPLIRATIKASQEALLREILTSYQYDYDGMLNKCVMTEDILAIASKHSLEIRGNE